MKRIDSSTVSVITERKKNGFKLKEGRFRLDTQKMSFTVRVEWHWNKFPGDVVDAIFLETFRARLDQDLGSLI